MRILATSDLHANRKQMDWVSMTATCQDLILLAGDLLNAGNGREEVSDWVRGLPCPVAISSGNHDFMKEGIDWLYDLRGPERLIDQAGILAGVPVCALPWQYPDGDWLEQAEVDYYCLVSTARARMIVLSHYIPPTDYQGPENVERVEDFQSAISGSLTFHGHDHRGWRTAGGIICAGQCNGPVPNHAFLNWENREGELRLRIGDSRKTQTVPFFF
ncbi:hypothetical protein BH09VER1_BH09VER1_47560 [soil metagenome]